MKSSAVTKQTELCYLVKQWNFILKKVRVKVNPCFEKKGLKLLFFGKYHFQGQDWTISISENIYIVSI